MADMTEKCDLETLACILVGKDNESIKKMKKADDAVASRTFGLMGGGIADTLEVTAETSEDVRARQGSRARPSDRVRPVCSRPTRHGVPNAGLLVDGRHPASHGQGRRGGVFQGED